MRRLTRWLVSSLAALSLLAGVWLPAVPAAAEGGSGTVSCEPGEFLREINGGNGTCVGLPNGNRIPLGSTATWTGMVYFRANNYRLHADSGWSILSLSVKLDGQPVNTQAYIPIEEGWHELKLEATASPADPEDPDGDASLIFHIWVRDCPSGQYKAEYNEADEWNEDAPVPLYSTCSPTLGGSWPDGRPHEVRLDDWWVRYSGPVQGEESARLVVSHNGSQLEIKQLVGNGSNDWVAVELPDENVEWHGNVVVVDYPQANWGLRLDYLPPDSGPASLDVDSCGVGDWLGLYYRDSSSSQPAFATCEARPDYTWTPDQPGPWAGNPNPPHDSWRATWDAWVDFDAGTYVFYVDSDGDVELQVNETYPSASLTGSAPVAIPDGPSHIQFQYTASPGAGHNRVASLWWASEGSEEAVPRCPAGSLLAEYSATGWARGADLAACETPGQDLGLRHPAHWVRLDGYHIRWSGNLLMPAGQYSFAAQTSPGNSAELWLNGHPVLSSISSVSPSYHLDHGTYRVEGTYAGNGSEPTNLINWTYTGAKVTTCEGDFLVEYSNGASACQPLALPGQGSRPVLLENVSSIKWTGSVTFDPGRYLFSAPDGGVKLGLKQGSNTLTVLDGTAATDEPTEWYLDGTYQMSLEMQTAPGQPLPRIWWTPTGMPRLVAYTVTGETTVALTFDRELRPAPDGATTAFYAYHKANDELVPNEVTKVSVSGRNVTLTLKNSVFRDQTATLSYFPAPEAVALEDATHGPATADLALDKPAAGGECVTVAPISGVTGPLEGESRDALLLTPQNSDWQVDLGDAYWLDEVRVGFTRKPETGALTLWVSTAESPADWTSVHTWDLATLDGASAVSLAAADLPSPHLLARRLRLTYEGGEAVGIDRFQAFGSPHGNVVSFFPTLTFTGDTAAPALVKRTGDDREKVELNVDLIVLTYDKTLDARSVPALTDYTVTVDGRVNEVTSVVVQENTVTLYLKDPVKFGQEVKLRYTPGTTPVRDLAGHPAAGFTEKEVDPVSVEMIDLARWGQPKATQSSSYNDDAAQYGAGKAIDGNPGSVARTQKEASPWWQVDLGQVSTLFDLKLLVPAGSGSTLPQFRVVVSEDGKLWSSAYQHPGTGIGDEGLTVDLKGCKAQYLRIETSEFTDLAFSEIEIWGFPPRTN